MNILLETCYHQWWLNSVHIMRKATQHGY